MRPINGVATIDRKKIPVPLRPFEFAIQAAIPEGRTHSKRKYSKAVLPLPYKSDLDGVRRVQIHSFNPSPRYQPQ